MGLQYLDRAKGGLCGLEMFKIIDNNDLHEKINLPQTLNIVLHLFYHILVKFMLKY